MTIAAMYLGEMGAPVSMLHKPAPAPRRIAVGKMKIAPAPARSPAPVRKVFTAAKASTAIARAASAVVAKSPTIAVGRPSSSSSSAPADSSSTDAASSSSSGGGGGGGDFATFSPPTARAGGEDVPTKDAYVSVSGGLPDAALYALMAAGAAVVGYMLWRRKGKR